MSFGKVAKIIRLLPQLPQVFSGRSIGNILPFMPEHLYLEGKRGLVLGVYESEEGGKLTDTAQKFDDRNNGHICEYLKSLERPMRLGQTMVFTNLDPDFFNVCLVGVGQENAGYHSLEQRDECKENVRIAAAVGARELQETGVKCILLENFADSEAAAEGAQMAVWRYQEFKNDEEKLQIPMIDLYGCEDREEWDRGIIKAQAQNLARNLSHCPANCMTPVLFTQTAADVLCPCGIQLETRDKDWMISTEMHALLAVAKSSCEKPQILEIAYCGGPLDDKPVLLVGKGTTYNSGGVCIFREKELDDWRGDMSAAAVIVATVKAAAQLALPMNIQGVIPLCENMPSGMALKPGDTVQSMAGKSIQVGDTGVEGSLMVCDALTYGQREYKPKLVVDVATMTRGVRHCLGAGASGAFANDHDLWREIHKAGMATGDRVWRLPLWEHFTNKVTGFPGSDLHNIGLGQGGSACISAAFLKEFIICNDWLHLDTLGTGMVSRGEEIPYLRQGCMTGRPTRTLLQFLYQIACGHAFAKD